MIPQKNSKSSGKEFDFLKNRKKKPVAVENVILFLTAIPVSTLKEDLGITRSAAQLIIKLAHLISKKDFFGPIYATQEYLMGALGCSEGTVRNCQRSLVATKVITREKQKVFARSGGWEWSSPAMRFTPFFLAYLKAKMPDHDDGDQAKEDQKNLSMATKKEGDLDLPSVNNKKETEADLSVSILSNGIVIPTKTLSPTDKSAVLMVLESIPKPLTLKILSLASKNAVNIQAAILYAKTLTTEIRSWGRYLKAMAQSGQDFAHLLAKKAAQQSQKRVAQERKTIVQNWLAEQSGKYFGFGKKILQVASPGRVILDDRLLPLTEENIKILAGLLNKEQLSLCSLIGARKFIKNSRKLSEAISPKALIKEILGSKATFLT